MNKVIIGSELLIELTLKLNYSSLSLSMVIRYSCNEYSVIVHRYEMVK
jgi:hypothetical protein